MEIRPRANSQACCSGCGPPAPGYDTLPPRQFAFVPLWGLQVLFVYAPRRVACHTCGVRVERMPWADGKHHLTTASLGLVSGEVGQAAQLEEGGQDLPNELEHRLPFGGDGGGLGRAHQELAGSQSIGVDEIQ